MYDGDPKLLIADDEAPARSRLRDMVADIGGWNVVAEVSNGQAVIEHCEQQSPDVVLLDIRMPEMDGIEVASHLCSLPTPPAVIFTTAYDEYAVKAFDTHAVGYLLKPVRRERLLRALEYAVRLSRMQLAELARNHPGLGRRTSMAVSHAGQIRLVPSDDVLAFQADQKYVRMTHSGGSDLIDESLKALEEEFGEHFVRLHRNSLVRLSAIESVERAENGHYFARVRGLAEPCQVSRRHVKNLKARLRS
ncbi:MAG: LytTR family DNA-binding domain-containing protein [Gammaproteobacteria bacterium]|jgi:two-component system response regulator AlgR|nr:LytTR family DNA-binding domain-containing protein [Gammaproteobacteria bacterium]MDP6617450.1 LytTR family DNA-binding domain-containing protein [Gammaproteobacteria bacterium]